MGGSGGLTNKDGRTAGWLVSSKQASLFGDAQCRGPVMRASIRAAVPGSRNYGGPVQGRFAKKPVMVYKYEYPLARSTIWK
jgi:hypothetical protein